ncbi:hypothetical protein [Blautia sp. HCP3S3_C4]|uniref:hypothetical protein n=1 Tax=Blautia sp. HCP3S3_C4 TaxID=3438911 RepID=UPI003F8CE6C5
MKNSEKCMILRQLTSTSSVSEYYKALERIGDIKSSYGDYLITEPINCNIELERLPGSDYDLCCALLTMLLREDHFRGPWRGRTLCRENKETKFILKVL